MVRRYLQYHLWRGDPPYGSVEVVNESESHFGNSTRIDDRCIPLDFDEVQNGSDRAQG